MNIKKRLDTWSYYKELQYLLQDHAEISRDQSADRGVKPLFHKAFCDQILIYATFTFYSAIFPFETPPCVLAPDPLK